MTPRPMTLAEAVHASALRQRDAAVAEARRLRSLLTEARHALLDAAQITLDIKAGNAAYDLAQRIDATLSETE